MNQKCVYKQKVFSSLKYNEYQKVMDNFFKKNQNGVISTGRQAGKSMFLRHLALTQAGKLGKKVVYYCMDGRNMKLTSEEIGYMIHGKNYKAVTNCIDNKMTYKTFSSGGEIHVHTLSSLTQGVTIPQADVYLVDEPGGSQNFKYLLDALEWLTDEQRFISISTPLQSSAFNTLYKSRQYAVGQIPIITPSWDTLHLTVQEFDERVKGEVL